MAKLVPRREKSLIDVGRDADVATLPLWRSERRNEYAGLMAFVRMCEGQMFSTNRLEALEVD